MKNITVMSKYWMNTSFQKKNYLQKLVLVDGAYKLDVHLETEMVGGVWYVELFSFFKTFYANRMNL